MGVTRGDLNDRVGILINIRRLTLRSQFCFDNTFIGGQDATIGPASLARENEAGGSWGQEVHILHVNI